MEISVKNFKDQIQEEFHKFHNLLDRRQETLTSKIDEYLCTQNRKKNLNPVKLENSPEPSTIDSAPPSQLSVLQFIAEDKLRIVDKKPKIFEIKFQLFKEPVEKEIEQCGEIKMEQIVEPSTPISQRPEVIDFSDVPSPVHEACSFSEKQKELALPFKVKRELSECEGEELMPPTTDSPPKINPQNKEDSNKNDRSKPEEIKESGSEYDVMRKQINRELHKGDIWCLLNSEWFKRWRIYNSTDKNRITKSMHPGPIDNSCLMNSTGLLREKLVHNIDYKLVPMTAWKRLESAYGVKGPTIRRWVVEYGNFIKRLRVEIYPLALNCQIEREGTRTEKVIYMSRVANFQNLETQIRLTLKLNSGCSLKIFYRSHTNNNWIELNDATLTPQTLDFYEGQEIGVKITQNNERLKKSRKGGTIETNIEKKRKESQR